jgi:hypothetical protein
MYSIKHCKDITFLLKSLFFYMFYNIKLLFYLTERLPNIFIVETVNYISKKLSVYCYMIIKKNHIPLFPKIIK